MWEIQDSLTKAAADFRYLLNRGYPRKPGLELVGNRYSLSFEQRHLLHRGVFSDEEALARRRKKVSLQKLTGHKLAVDGHNVLITIEAGLDGRPLVSADDGFIRDTSGLSSNYRGTELTDRAVHLLLDFLKKAKPSHSLFLFDAPISKSGLLAQDIRNRLLGERLSGDARAVKVPEQTLIGFPGIVATSDTAIIDRSVAVFDIAGFLIQRQVRPISLLKLKRQ